MNTMPEAAVSYTTEVVPPAGDSRLLTLAGPIAYSTFRVSALVSNINTAVNSSAVTAIRAIYVHYIALRSNEVLKSAAESPKRTLLESLLCYDTAPDISDPGYATLVNAVVSHASRPAEPDNYLIRVVPRVGTISPWSSKATNIAHVCGLVPDVERIERGVAIMVSVRKGFPLMQHLKAGVSLDCFYDRMTQAIVDHAPTYNDMFEKNPPKPLVEIQLGKSPKDRLEEANRKFGLALASDEIAYLVEAFHQLGPGRNPTDVELFMFAQVNSEHCRHKIFNADWKVDGEAKALSLFKMIRNTHEKVSGAYTISAYSDNAAVMEGAMATHFAPDLTTNEWLLDSELVHYLGKVETHNHPTAVSPFPGAATGSGGEIRDEGAVGRGSRPKAGLAGYTVSDLLIPECRQPWELDVGKPGHIASSLDIMIEAPLGGASFNNEFGRPCISGYFRTLTTTLPLSNGKHEIRGYHKPIMIAGGVGSVRPMNALKDKQITPGACLIVMGGPAMLIGLGGGAASSVASGDTSVELDYASVQRGNPEMQRRVQMVIDACTALGVQNPIQSIHDVGAGGLSNALPELVHDHGLGAQFELRDIPSSEPGMSPMEIWCCEAQERYVLAVAKSDLETFSAIAHRERCPFAVVGRATTELRLVLTDKLLGTTPIDLEMSILFGKPPKMSRTATTRHLKIPPFDSTLASYVDAKGCPLITAQTVTGSHSHSLSNGGSSEAEKSFKLTASPASPLKVAVERVLHLPSVGSKSFLITIGDRTVTGLIARDQMVGPWQVPVADVGVTVSSLGEGVLTGEALSMGERPALALISPRASAQMTVAESLLNLIAADIKDLEHVRLSANWMAAPAHDGEGAALYEAVQAVGLEMCPELGISIPVGKDSMSMKMKWEEDNGGKTKETKEVTAPMSLIVTAFAAVTNVHNTWTPQLRRVEEPGIGATKLLLVDLACGKARLGGSAVAQVFGKVGNVAPEVESMPMLKNFITTVSILHQIPDLVLAYHDRSDGGLLTTLLEMAFAGRVGLHIDLPDNGADVVSVLFNEELGAVFQVKEEDVERFIAIFEANDIDGQYITPVAAVRPSKDQAVTINFADRNVFESTRGALQQAWSLTSYKMQRLRDNPKSADQEYANILDNFDPGLLYRLTFDVKDNLEPVSEADTADVTPATPILNLPVDKPKVAILREQGVNGHSEMAYAFHSSGFIAVDVHMTDLISGRVSLDSFVGLAACGGFSYGDVLGAGAGWAKSVLWHQQACEEFRRFFNDRKDTFALGVCNGCQFITQLKDIIPGAENWPTFQRNASEQFEGRVCEVEIVEDAKEPSVFLHGMRGSKFPIAVAHGEGRAVFENVEQAKRLTQDGLVAVRFVDNYGKITEKYPFNPNGSPGGITGVRTPDGRVLALMPHPERVIFKESNSWYPVDESKDWGELGPWIRLFRSARQWVGA
ncbi:CobB/CobQ-like glutamine amidotransferase domain-containing protein [Lipomyces chichibuensis]|uniref:CobB/CobQ-like glutamine amidotransferase domain-containing protein n=1 Tax=Lipomyces chichibuensis TaxID=1546026 RepID=UPI003343734A